MKNNTIYRLGLVCLVSFLVLQRIFARFGYVNDATDFIVGLLAGTSFALLLMFIWRRRRAREGHMLSECEKR